MSIKNVKWLLLTFISAFCALGIAKPVFAEENTETPAVWLQISPVANRISLEPGQVVEDEFTVENVGAESFSYKIYATPYYANSDSADYDLNFSVENNYTQIVRWITFCSSDGECSDNLVLDINPGDKQTIKYRVNVPDDIPSGGQYATLFAESINKNSQEDATGVKTVSRVGLVLYANAKGDTRSEATISDYYYEKFLLSGKLKASAKITNSGNTDFNASYSYIAKTLFGKTLVEDKNSYFVLPETTRTINYEWDKTPFMGIFQVTYKVSALDKTEEHTSVVLILPMFMLIIMIMLLTIIVLWIIILVRKRNERRSRLLE